MARLPFLRRGRVAASDGPGPIPTIAPSLAWSGTQLADSLAPNLGVKIARTGNKPQAICLWTTPSECRITGDHYVGVHANCKGGIANVTFWLEGTTVVVDRRRWLIDTDANGVARARYDYWVKVDGAAARAASGNTGSMRMFATANPVDTAFADPRMIGYATVTNLDGNYPMILYPRPTVNDATFTFGTGGTYATLALAMAAAEAAVAKAPEFRAMATAAYEAANRTTYTAGEGRAAITAAPGVTATFGHAADFSTMSGVYLWRPGWQGLEFRGEGVVLDCANMSGLEVGTKSPWMNGCLITNSRYAEFPYYFNGGGQPAIYFFDTVAANNPVFGYWDDAIIEHCSAVLTSQRHVRGCGYHKILFNDVVTGTHYVADNYLLDMDISPLQHYNAALGGMLYGLRISYTGPGAASILKAAGDVAGGVLAVTTNGSTTNIPLGFFTENTNPTIQDVVDDLNAISGITAVVLNGRGGMRASSIGRGFLGADYSTIPLTTINSTPRSIPAGGDPHVDVWQNGEVDRENVAFVRNTARDILYVSAFLKLDGTCRDFDLSGNVGMGYYTDGVTLNGPGQFHIIFDDNTMEGYVTVNTDAVYNRATHSIRNTFGESLLPTTASWDNAPALIGNVYGASSTPSIPNTGLHSGNTNWGTPNYVPFQAAFRNYGASDFRPALDSFLLTYLKAKVNDVDMFGNERDDLDVAGAISVNAASAKVWPF